MATKLPPGQAKMAAAAKPKPIPPAYKTNYMAGMGVAPYKPKLNVIKPQEPARKPNPGIATGLGNQYQNIDWGSMIPQSPDLGGGNDSSGGGGGSGYYGYDFSNLLAQQGEDVGAATISTGSRIKQALIDLGLSEGQQYEGLSPEVRNYIDKPTLEAAKNNKYSVFAQVADRATKQTAQQRAALAARGMLSSGQLTKTAQDITEGAEADRYAGTREFSGAAQQALEGLATLKRQWAQRVADARMEAAMNGYGGGGGGGGGGGTPAHEFGTGVGRPGEWADLPVLEGWQPGRNVDARYDMSNAQPDGQGGYVGPQGQRYDDKGRVR